MTNSKLIYKYTRDLNVLYIDSEKFLRRDTLKIFKPFFKNVTIATNAKEGLAKYIKYYKSNNIYYDIIFTDIELEDMDGHQLIDELYQINSKQIIVVLANKQENNVLIKLIDQDIASFILKPIKDDDLARVLFKISNNISHGKITKKYTIGMKKFNKLLKERVRDEISKNTQKEVQLLEQELALKKEQEIQKHKDMFLAKMSHDIRTPLNGIIGFTKIIQETNLNKKQSKYIELISTSSNILANIINDILDFSKIAEGKLELDLQPTNCRKEALSFLNIFKSQIKNKGLEFIINIDPKLPECMIYDKNRLKQIVMNLIGNSIKFTNKGSIEFREELLSKNDKKATVKYSIIDTGIGIAIDKQKNIFKAFTQENKSISSKFGGTGLGISIADELLTLYGSKLKLISKPNVGTEFYFILELEICNKKLVSDEYEINNNKCKFKNSHILIAEDNLINQELIENILNGKNIDTTIANNGIEAIEIYKNDYNKFNIILMDINMPNMSGLEALNKIREYEEDNNIKSIPIIALTANTIKGDEEKYINLGMNDYLAKPINIKKLDEVLIKYLEQIPSKKILKSEEKSTEILSYNMKDIAEELEISISFAEKLLDKFLKKFNIQIEEMKELAKKKDFNKLNNLLHAVKGTSGNLRLKSIEKLINRLEKHAKLKDTNFAWMKYFDVLNTYVEDYKNQLKK